MKKTLFVATLCMAVAGMTGCKKDENKPEEQKKEEQKKEEQKKEGDACDKKNEFVCNGDVLLICYPKSEKSTTLVYQEYYDCSESKMQCKTNKASGSSYCVNSCKKGDTGDLACYVDEWEETVAQYKMNCEENSDGSYGYWEDESQYKECDDGFCHAGIGCQKLVSNEGQKCNSEEYEEKCDGNNVVYCSGGEIVAYSCGANGDFGIESTCKTMKDKNYVDCTLSCTTAGQFQGDCYSKEEYRAILSEEYGKEFTADDIDVALFANVFICEETSDNGLGAFFYTEEIYASECTANSFSVSDADKGVALNIGDKCNSYLFESRCAGDILLGCDLASEDDENATVLSENCSCSVIDGEAQCTLGPCDDSTTDSYECEAYSFFGYDFAFSNMTTCISDDSNVKKLVVFTELCETTCIDDDSSSDYGRCAK